MITRKEQEVLAITFEIPTGFDPFEYKFKRDKRNKSPLMKLREDHIKALHARGVSMSQIARAYKISRQRVHQIIRYA